MVGGGEGMTVRGGMTVGSGTAVAFKLTRVQATRKSEKRKLPIIFFRICDGSCVLAKKQSAL
jgi:hypothetical protein